MPEALATPEVPGKRRAALQLEGWSITLGLQGYGAADGSGWIAIEQEGVLQPIREFDDEGRPDDFWLLNLGVGDFTAVRDWLNRQLPPTNLSYAERCGVREALLSSVLLAALKRLMAAERAASKASREAITAARFETADRAAAFAAETKAGAELTAAWQEARAAIARAEAAQ